MASPELIADVRYSVNIPANTTAAVAYAVQKAALPRILIEAIFSQPTDEFGQPSLYFGPTYCSEVQALKNMSMIDWLSTIAREHELPKVDIIEEILTVKGIEELWIYLNIPSEKMTEAIDILSFDANNDERIVLVSNHALPPKTHFRTADPTGKGTYILHSGSLLDRMRYSMEHERTVSLKHQGHSYYQIKTIV